MYWEQSNCEIPLHTYCCCFSVNQSYPTLCDPMDRSTPGFPVLRYLLEFAQTHVHSFSNSDHVVAKSPTWLNDWTTERHVSIHCYSISQRIFTAWKILSAWPIHPSSYQPLETNDDFTVSVVLPFLGCHILEWYGMYSLSDWLISVSNMHLRFLHVFSWLNSLFLLKAE